MVAHGRDGWSTVPGERGRLPQTPSAPEQWCSSGTPHDTHTHCKLLLTTEFCQPESVLAIWPKVSAFFFCTGNKVKDWTEQGLTSHSTHFRSFRGYCSCRRSQSPQCVWCWVECARPLLIKIKAFSKETKQILYIIFFYVRSAVDNKRAHGNEIIHWHWHWNQSINQSINLYRAIVQRRVLQCSFAESKRNILRWILNVLTDGAVQQFSGRVPKSRSSNRETTSSSVQVVRRNWQKLLCGWSQQGRLTVWADQISEIAWLLERSNQITKFGEFEVDPLPDTFNRFKKWSQVCRHLV